MSTDAAIRRKFRALASRLDEHTRRVCAATEARALGYGGISLVAHATGISRRAILVGLREIEAGDILPEGRVRRAGGVGSALHGLGLGLLAVEDGLDAGERGVEVVGHALHAGHLGDAVPDPMIAFWTRVRRGQQMTSRERVLLALAHKEPDRVPVDLGSTIVTGISAVAYKNLASYWHLKTGEVRLMEILQQLAEVEEPMLRKVGADAVILWPEYPAGWKEGALSDGTPCLVPEDFNPEIQDDGSRVLKNEEGTIITKMPEGGFYFDEVYHPLQNAETPEDVEKFAWPYTASREELDGLRRRAEYLHEMTEYAVVADTLVWGQIYEVLQHLRGWDTFMMDVAGKTKMADYLLDKRLEVCLERFRQYLDTFGKYIDVVVVGDDLGMQDRPQLSPELYWKMLKPRQKKLYAYIKSKTDARLFMHACGSVYDFIPDYIDMGVDILNPVQVGARNMDSARLKKEFGRHVAFWGGGCDAQYVLPFASPETVREEVRRRIGDLAPEGGFVFNTVHNIQADVPVENLAAMYEAVQEFGQYS